MTLDAETERRLEVVLGEAVVAALAVDRGYTNNRRWTVGLASGRSVFVKQAADETTAAWLRSEHAVYAGQSCGFMAEMVGWDDDGGVCPTLVLEDLSGCIWPPPWTRDRIDAVLAAMDEMAGSTPAAGLDRAGAETWYTTENWHVVAENPEPFLSLGLCTRRWFDNSIGRLVDAADPAGVEGDRLVHQDVRSDNICIRDETAVLVDWNFAALGNPEFDLAFWLPSLQTEGGPPPEQVAEITPSIVALVAGFFASQAGLPVIAQAPLVRSVQRTQLAAALPWAVRALALPPLDGSHPPPSES